MRTLIQIIKWPYLAIKSSILCCKYPFLRIRTIEGKPIEKIPTMTFLDDFPKGWRKAFGIEMCKELRRELKHCGDIKALRIYDVKEKYGELSISADCPYTSIYDILGKYEYISYRTCIRCGRRAKYVTQSWVESYCEDCVPKNKETVQFYEDENWYGYLNFKPKEHEQE